MYVCAGRSSGTEKRFFHHDEALLAAHPEFLDPASASLDARLDIVKTAVPELAASASRKAIAEWGRPATDITHLVVATVSGAHMPGVDFRLVQLLGLPASVRRTMLYLGGCFAGVAALRVAKDLAENNRDARVLVVCAELTIMLFAPPEEGNLQTLVNMGFFGDGAGAVIIGADPSPAERPLFEIMSAAQTIIPETQDALIMQLGSGGLGGSSATGNLPEFIGGNIERCLLDSFSPLGIDVPNWNDLFWVVHPGTQGILRRLDTVLQLKPDKLAASRRVLRDYGNMFGATVIFVLHEICKHSLNLNEWGVLTAFGPGITIETLLLRTPKKRLHNGKYSFGSKL
jgi:bisdemethoxycurcumin synthase